MELINLSCNRMGTKANVWGIERFTVHEMSIYFVKLVLLTHVVFLFFLNISMPVFVILI